MCTQTPSPPAPSEHLDIPLYCSHSNPARSHAHTEIKTLPATAPGARGGGASRSRGGAAEDSSYRASPTLGLCRNKQRAGEATLGVRWGEGRADYRQVWGWGVKWGLPITARGIRHHKNPPPLSKVLGLSWDVNSAERHGAPFSCAEIERTFFWSVFGQRLGRPPQSAKGSAPRLRRQSSMLGAGRGGREAKEGRFGSAEIGVRVEGRANGDHTRLEN